MEKMTRHEINKKVIAKMRELRNEKEISLHEAKAEAEKIIFEEIREQEEGPRYTDESFRPEEVTIEQVKKLMDEKECSMSEAKKELKNQNLKDKLHLIRQHGTDSQKINWLIDRFAETLT